MIFTAWGWGRGKGRYGTVIRPDFNTIGGEIRVRQPITKRRQLKTRIVLLHYPI